MGFSVPLCEPLRTLCCAFRISTQTAQKTQGRNETKRIFARFVWGR